jgi:predicted GIY-YIG superfamily endonuclease
VKPLFVAPSWKLARNKKSEIGINSTVWARVISDDPEKIDYIKSVANVLIVDEVSMMTEGQKQFIFSNYSDMKIIMCGDLGYQLSPIIGEECNLDGFDNIVRYKGSYRCKCPVLRSILDDLRLMISCDRSKKEINEYVIGRFKEIHRVIKFEELKSIYSIEDMILCGTNELKKVFTDEFAGKFSVEKYYVTENNRLYNNGEIVIGEKPADTKCDVQHAFTTHSIQGETAKHNLFIESSKMFDCRMFYTALSRASYIEQIQIIEPMVKQFKYEYAKIYKIESKNGLYIGSTIHPLEKRFQEHKNGYEQHKNGKGKFITSYSLLDDKDATIKLVEIFKCDDLKDLWAREAEIIQSCQCVNKTFNELGKSQENIPRASTGKCHDCGDSCGSYYRCMDCHYAWKGINNRSE